MSTFAGLSMVLGLYLVPAGALMTQRRYPLMFAAMAGNLVPLLAPTNEMTYDAGKFTNTAT